MWGLDWVLNLGFWSDCGRTWKDFRFVILERFGKDCGDFDRILNGLGILNRFGRALMFWKDLENCEELVSWRSSWVCRYLEKGFWRILRERCGLWG